MNEAQNADDESEEERLSSEEADDADDRRRDFRHLACFPAHLHAGQGIARSALIRDLSVSGAHLLTRARFKVGDPIELSLYLDDRPDAHKVAAHVVRVERRTGDRAHPWTMSLGVRFDAALTEIEPQVKALADRQAALFGRDGRDGRDSTK
jgi:Tfp pilus assembly protein PilZ